jgi:hypothetical protein
MQSIQGDKGDKHFRKNKCNFADEQGIPFFLLNSKPMQNTMKKCLIFLSKKKFDKKKPRRGWDGIKGSRIIHIHEIPF